MLVRVARVRNEAIWLGDSLRKYDSELWPKEQGRRRRDPGKAGVGREGTEHLLSQWQDLRMAGGINSVDS